MKVLIRHILSLTAVVKELLFLEDSRNPSRDRKTRLW